MLPKSDSLYYSPSPLADGPEAFILTFLIIVALIAAIVWLVSWPPGKKKKDIKTVREEIEGIFKDLRESAVQFKRDSALGPLQTAEKKITTVLGKKGLLERT